MSWHAKATRSLNQCSRLQSVIRVSDFHTTRHPSALLQEKKEKAAAAHREAVAKARADVEAARLREAEAIKKHRKALEEAKAFKDAFPGKVSHAI